MHCRTKLTRYTCLLISFNTSPLTPLPRHLRHLNASRSPFRTSATTCYLHRHYSPNPAAIGSPWWPWPKLASAKFLHTGNSNPTIESTRTETERKQSNPVLPEELLEEADVLTCESTAEGGTCNVYLIGNRHGCQESRKQVREMINSLKPKVVFFDLNVTHSPLYQTDKAPTIDEMEYIMWRPTKNKPFEILRTWCLARFVNTFWLDLAPEFRVGLLEAMKCGAKVKIGDLPVEIILNTVWVSKSIQDTFSAILQSSNSENLEDIWKSEQLQGKGFEKEVRAIVSWMQKVRSIKLFPAHEKAQYMAATLLDVASEHSSIVAVVGMEHVSGIKEYWKQPISMDEIIKIPTQKYHATAKQTAFYLTVAKNGFYVFCIVMIVRYFF